MGKQVIISIGREYGSGGHIVAGKISKSLNLPLYDRNILDEISEKTGSSYEQYRPYDEKVPNPLLTRSVRGQSNSVEKIVAEIQFDFLREKAKKGESFVVLGRCADEILQGTDGLITIFLLGDLNVRKQRVMEVSKLSEADALAKIKRHDRKRKLYHNTYSSHKWGDSRTYDICINTSRLGIEATADELLRYIEARINQA